MVEKLVFFHVLSLKKRDLFPKNFYWMDKARNEMDIVFTLNGKIIPIEVKYVNEIVKKDGGSKKSILILSRILKYADG